MATLLIVDDEKDIVSALEIYLKSEGYEILTANSGKQAVDIMHRKRVDLIPMSLS